MKSCWESLRISNNSDICSNFLYNNGITVSLFKVRLNVFEVKQWEFMSRSTDLPRKIYRMLDIPSKIEIFVRIVNG